MSGAAGAAFSPPPTTTAPPPTTTATSGASTVADAGAPAAGTSDTTAASGSATPNAQAAAPSAPAPADNVAAAGSNSAACGQTQASGEGGIIRAERARSERHLWLDRCAAAAGGRTGRIGARGIYARPEANAGRHEHRAVREHSVVRERSGLRGQHAAREQLAGDATRYCTVDVAAATAARLWRAELIAWPALTPRSTPEHCPASCCTWLQRSAPRTATRRRWR